MGCWVSKPVAPEPMDYYRTGPLRYLGYAAHIGRACGMLLPQSASFVPQMVTTAYICADVFDKTLKSSERGEPKERVVISAVDALIWQALASVIIPGIIFSGIRSGAKNILMRQSKAGTCTNQSCCVSPLTARILPCALALLATPFIMRPIDRGVDYLMNSTYREWTKPEPVEYMKPHCCAREERLRAERAAREAREALERAKKEEQQRLDKLKQEEKEAKELARKKCLEEAKALKEKLAEEDRALKERLRREQQEFREKQLQLERELKQKATAPMQCD